MLSCGVELAPETASHILLKRCYHFRLPTPTQEKQQMCNIRRRTLSSDANLHETWELQRSQKKKINAKQILKAYLPKHASSSIKISEC
jgi:hypothetical protein